MNRAQSVRLIMSVLDRAAASPHNLDDADAGHSLVILSASKIFDLGDDTLTIAGGAWTGKQARAVVLALALNAPADDLRLLVQVARRELAWLEWWDAKGWAESNGYVMLKERAA